MDQNMGIKDRGLPGGLLGDYLAVSFENKTNLNAYSDLHSTLWANYH
jgi:hypothetical protein